ncbi:MAG: hypothetical protein QM809_05090 [Gordonia sp. (in: high G+C Gram-positive bacteria)]|uniref:hypothetical protein n=1 Tax=Gordonia sp. (in: high G+C Gram-positive bacteria) TaxID=84139 RepID=UPI0039E35EAA
MTTQNPFHRLRRSLAGVGITVCAAGLLTTGVGAGIAEANPGAVVQQGIEAGKVPVAVPASRYVGKWTKNSAGLTLRKNGRGNIVVFNGAANSETRNLSWRTTKTGIRITYGKRTRLVGQGAGLRTGQVVTARLARSQGVTYLQMAGRYTTDWCERDRYGAIRTCN